MTGDREEGRRWQGQNNGEAGLSGEADRGRDAMVPLEPARSFTSPLHSQGILVTNPGSLAFISGQVGVRPDGTIGHGIVEQTRLTFANIARILTEAELGLRDIASIRTYLTSHTDIAEFTTTAESHLGGHRPASTLIIVEHLANPSLLVQIEAVAVGH